MSINIDAIIYLANILNKNDFDEKEFNKFIKTKGMKGFLEHAVANVKNIKEELKEVVLDEDYRDKYEFYLIRKNIDKLNDDIDYIGENSELIINQALQRVYKIVHRSITINQNIYLYVGGNDGGFTINRNKIFINYGKYVGCREEFMKILSHELYHSRNFSMKNRFVFIFKMVLKPNRLLYEIMGKCIEEGIACLIQHGAILKVDDPTGTLTNRNLMFVKEEFKRLNDILLDIKFDRVDYKDIRNLNIYTIGYHIVSTVYNMDGKLILDDWTINLEYKRIIEKYMELCNINNISIGFISE